MSDIFRPQWALDDKPPDFSSVLWQKPPPHSWLVIQGDNTLYCAMCGCNVGDAWMVDETYDGYHGVPSDKNSKRHSRRISEIEEWLDVIRNRRLRYHPGFPGDWLEKMMLGRFDASSPSSVRDSPAAVEEEPTGVWQDPPPPRPRLRPVPAQASQSSSTVPAAAAQASSSSSTVPVADNAELQRQAQRQRLWDMGNRPTWWTEADEKNPPAKYADLVAKQHKEPKPEATSKEHADAGNKATKKKKATKESREQHEEPATEEKLEEDGTATIANSREMQIRAEEAKCRAAKMKEAARKTDLPHPGLATIAEPAASPKPQPQPKSRPDWPPWSWPRHLPLPPRPKPPAPPAASAASVAAAAPQLPAPQPPAPLAASAASVAAAAPQQPAPPAAPAASAASAGSAAPESPVQRAWPRLVSTAQVRRADDDAPADSSGRPGGRGDADRRPGRRRRTSRSRSRRGRRTSRSRSRTGRRTRGSLRLRSRERSVRSRRGRR
jgi:hypothetical protein